MVWGAFSYVGVAELHVFPKSQSVTKDVYCSLLDSRLADCFAATGAEVLQQDGAPCHTAHTVKEWLATSEVECIPDWPAKVQTYRIDELPHLLISPTRMFYSLSLSLSLSSTSFCSIITLFFISLLIF